MSRKTLDITRVDEAIRDKHESDFAETVEEVRQTVEREGVVVIGMEYNPYCARARKALQKANIPFTYLEYGGYTKEWRRRTAIKMWSGWHTFPQVFVKGVLIGGADQLNALLASGELARRLA